MLASIFALILPGTAYERYRFGAAFTYDRMVTQSNLPRDNLREEERQPLIASAKRSGVLYAALHVAGGLTPIFGLFAILLLEAFSIRTTRFQLVGGFVLVAFGATLSVCAAIQLGPIPGASVQDGIFGAVGLWIGFLIIFLLLFGAIALGKRFIR